MRLWSLAPRLLDTKALVACWREALLARHVLLGLTKGYTNHPQLLRFKRHSDPVAAINGFLREIFAESQARAYHFDPGKLVEPLGELESIPVTAGQLAYEFELLKQKAAGRDPAKFREIEGLTEIAANPLFRVEPGPIEAWERVIDSVAAKTAYSEK